MQGRVDHVGEVIGKRGVLDTLRQAVEQAAHIRGEYDVTIVARR